MTERQLQDEIVAVAQQNGWWVYHTFNSRRSREGWPDLVLLRGQMALFLECKRQRGALSSAQEDVIGRLQRVREVHAAVVRPQHLGEVLELLVKAKR